MLSSLVQERIGAKWRPIHTNDRFKKGPEDTTRTFALHIEGASNCTEIIRQKLAKWYGSQSRTFPDGTKMWLVPPFHSIFFFKCKAKYSSLAARQAALSDRICSSSTWELTANLNLDKVDPTSGLTLRKILLAILSHIMEHKPLFHSVDRTWRSSNGITLTFLPENESDACSFVTGLIPFLQSLVHASILWRSQAMPPQLKMG